MTVACYGVLPDLDVTHTPLEETMVALLDRLRRRAPVVEPQRPVRYSLGYDKAARKFHFRGEDGSYHDMLEMRGTTLFDGADGERGHLFMIHNLTMAEGEKATLHNSTGPITAGTSLTGGNPFNSLTGRLAQFCLWPGRALSPLEIHWLYNNGQGRDLLRHT